MVHNLSQRLEQPALLGVSSATTSTEGVIFATAAIPRQKATAGPQTYWLQLLFTSMCALSFLCLEEDGIHSSGMGEEGNPFSGWVTVQAGMQRLWGQKESKHQRAQPGPCG